MSTGMRFVFDRFELDPTRRRLAAAGEPVAVPERQLDVLALLVSRAGQIVSKDDLLQTGWKDVAVGDNSLEQAISNLRRMLGASLIETVPRRGYRFAANVTRTAARESEAGLDALLAPHRAFIEGRAALETLERDGIARARSVFEEALIAAPEHPSAHIGLANACVMQFEMTRTDASPDTTALARAAHHAREACRLDAQSGEAWATLGFVLDRTGDRRDAPAASRRAVALEPGNWRHHLRLSYVSWGEERLDAAHRTLALLPRFALAHWLAATVHVARGALDEAERELDTALIADVGTRTAESRFSKVAAHWLLGLIRLAKGDETSALEAFDRELQFESAGQLYARECAANTWYAIGAVRLRQRREVDAAAAFRQAIERVNGHPLAHIGLAVATRSIVPQLATSLHGGASSVDAAMVRAAALAIAGDHAGAARSLEDALATAPPGVSGWILPVEPILSAAARPDVWAHALALVRHRAV